VFTNYLQEVKPKSITTWRILGWVLWKIWTLLCTWITLFT